MTTPGNGPRVPDPDDHRRTGRFTADGHEWHRHGYLHAHTDGGDPHGHPGLILAPQAAADLSDLLRRLARTHDELTETQKTDAWRAHTRLEQLLRAAAGTQPTGTANG